MKKQSLFFVPGIILIGVSLRTPFSENRLGASLHLQPLLLDHRLTYSTNQSAPALSRNLDGWGKCRSHQCPAS